MQLHILVPCSSPTASTVEVNGKPWSLQPFSFDDSGDDDGVKYSCISYTWGSGREPSPLNPSFLVSDCTVPALETLLRHRPDCSAIWIDAFCVPLTEPERVQTLKSMGYIYAHAAEVMVVLSSAALPALTRMLSSSRLDVTDVAVLESEEWVERAWTYQEVVNSKALFLTCGGEVSPVVPADRFFSCVGYALANLAGSIMSQLRAYPRLNAFEDIMADFYTADYEDRAALNVMSNMDRRVQGRPADHFYAMIGAISADWKSAVGEMHPCEAFMRVCEKKGDFSFIYSAAKREQKPFNRWRPVPGDLPSILPWHGWGFRQPGRLCDDGLWLDDMLVFQLAQPQDEAKSFIQNRLNAFWENSGCPEGTLEEAIYATLQVMGFAGTRRAATTTRGYFFPLKPITENSIISILVSNTLRWIIGAPGLMSYKDGHETVLYTPGVYVGAVEGENVASYLVG